MAKPVPFPVGAYRDREFGNVVVGVTRKPCHAEHLLGILGEREHRNIAVIIDVRQPRGKLVAQSPHSRKKAKPKILGTHMCGEFLKQPLVLGTDQAQPDDGPIGQLFRGSGLLCR